MRSRAKRSVAPIYLFACLLLGGAAQSPWSNLILQLAGLAIIAWTAALPSKPLPARAGSLLMIVAAAVALVAVESVPLPPALWAHGVRTRIAEDFLLLGKSVPSIPLSLTPHSSLTALLSLIPPLAIFCALTRLEASRASRLVAALIAGAVFGILELISATHPISWIGMSSDLGADLFRRPDHLALLLVIVLVFGLAAIRGGENPKSRPVFVAIGIIGLLIAGAGLMIVNSVLAWALAILVLLINMFTPTSTPRGFRRFVMLVGVIFLIVAGADLSQRVVTPDGVGGEPSETRGSILARTDGAIWDFLPLGSGLGSFARVYSLYESPETASGKRVLYAFNDYAELALELGVPGVVLVAAFFFWWISTVGRVWRVGEGGPFVQAAAIATVVIMIDSAVDFPLRTAAISGVFAMCLGLLVNRQAAFGDRPDLRPVRHVVIG